MGFDGVFSMCMPSVQESVRNSGSLPVLYGNARCLNEGNVPTFRNSTMSYCRQDGKDEIIFATNDDLGKPSSALIKSEEDDEPGLILPSGEINWNCPCLGGMASGPCGVSFREAFSCFHFSQSDPKGSDCYQQFRAMQECMSEYPELYPEKDDDNDLDLNKVSDEHGEVHLVEPHLETSREQCEENLPS